MILKTISVLLMSLFLTTAFAATAPTVTCKEFQSVVQKGTAQQKAQNFFKVSWKYQMLESPEFATYVGYPGQNDRWTDMSMAAIERRKKMDECILAALQKINRNEIKGEDRITYDLLLSSMKIANEGHKFDGDTLVLNHLTGIQIDNPDVLSASPTANLKDYENLVARLKALPVAVQQTEDLLKEGIKRKITPVKVFMLKVPAQFDALLPEKIEDSAFFLPFKNMRNTTAEQAIKIQDEAKSIIKSEVYPAYQNLKNFLVKDYIPNCRDEIAWSVYPNGTEWYNFLVKVHTTTNKSAKELHQLGLDEVERIKGEMEKVKASVGFKGSLKEFNNFLLKDSQFYFTKSSDLMMGYRDIAKRIDAELPKIFGKLPRLTYGVHEMPAYKAKDAPAAYYMGGAMEGGRAGFFEANTYDLKARPKWGMTALTLHEAVPGHHLQISLAQEIEGLPELRRNGGYTAFVEGWGLYAESLGEKIGMYEDPYSKYGELSYEMWRAVRLVVDTGMHSMNWTRDQAIQYFMDLIPKARLEAEVEIDRYIVWPGQALAYKVGQLKFLELRKKAEAKLGDKFDIRKFHDEVLSHGPLPMDVLEKTFDEWLNKAIEWHPSAQEKSSHKSK